MKNNIHGIPVLNLIIAAVCVAASIFFVITGAFIEEGYDISVGSVSPRKFIATDAVENTVATNKLKNEARASVSPLYTHNPETKEHVMKELKLFFDETNTFMKNLKESEESEVSSDFDAYIFQSLTPAPSQNGTVSSKVYLNQAQLETLKTLSTNELYSFENKLEKITDTVLEQGVREDSDKSASFIRDELSAESISPELQEIGYHIITSVIEPNLVVDAEATSKAREEKAAEIEPIMILKNQKIIDEGEIINDEVYEILNNLGFIQKNRLIENIVPIAGVSLFVTVLFFALFCYVKIYHSAIATDKKKALLILCIYMILLIVTRFIIKLPFAFAPILLFTLLISMLISSSLALVLNIVATIVCFLIYKAEVQFILYFLITGTIASLIPNFSSERNRLIFAGIISACINSIVAAGITLFLDNNYSANILGQMLYAFAGSMLYIMLSLGSLPLWEALFGIVTSMKLLELINPNKELLRRLMLEAPGTYHHSLIVANLAESAAYNINANSVLTRVGAYYHDIGKLKYPQYFSENVIGENLHDYMDPINSTKIITSHVEEGLKLAEKNKLPQAVCNIIQQHHGNTIVKFFYMKAEKKYSAEAIKKNDFRYKCPIPQSREAAIVMLADTVEAAVRSTSPSGKTMPEVEAIVKRLVKDKLDDNQLDDSGLTIKDLITISDSFMSIFKGMYHERIAYPDDKKNKEKEEKINENDVQQ